MKTYIHIKELVTLKNAHAKDGRNLIPDDLSIIKDGAIVFNSDEIIWVGETKDLPHEYQQNTIDLTGHILTPEIVDSHTHLIFGGDRASEYTERLNGVPYEEIARRGGGILLTMNQTNHSSADELYQSAQKRIERIASYGVGTIEVKSGYGLNFEKEYELSLLIDKLKKEFSPRLQIINTYMAAHDVPKSFKDSAHYMSEVVIPLLEKLAPLKIIDNVDIFHEKNYFTDADTTLLFETAQRLGIPAKMHGDELNDNGSASLGAKLGALSIDHLLKINDQGIKDLAQSSTVATLLPGTAFFLGKPLAPGKKLLDAGVKVAIASDYNPGSCHCDNVLMVAQFSAAQLRMNMAQTWCGITLNASHAVGLKDQGALIKGLKPRFSIFKAESLSHISYHWGHNFSVKLT
ncbi:MAG: imidazolonepropionase [Candidatus Caldatribacteriota bacterium]